MKIWLALILVAVLVSTTCLASCDWLGIGKSKEQKRYEQEVEAYRQQQEAYQKYMEEYYENLEKALNEYNQQYQEWQESQLQQVAQAEGGEVVVVTANQTQP
jgi:uncharacterized membrane-anchored protein YhcB (DUF1043 family)